MSQRNQSSQSRISSTFNEFAEALSGAAADPTKKVVHELRTNARRLETMIQHRLPSGSEKTFLGELKKIRQAAGTVRDVDVQSKLVDSFESQESTRGRAFVRAKLDLMRARNEKKLIQLLSPEALQEMGRLLKQCERKLATASRAHSGPQDEAGIALEQYSNLLCRFEPLGRDSIHEFRKACKHVRYLAELAPDSSRKEAVVDALTQIQDSIGDWHDILTLIDVAKTALKSPKHSAFIRELHAAEEKKLQESLETCQNAKQALIRLRAEFLAGQRKGPRSSGRVSRAVPSRVAS